MGRNFEKMRGKNYQNFGRIYTPEKKQKKITETLSFIRFGIMWYQNIVQSLYIMINF